MPRSDRSRADQMDFDVISSVFKQTQFSWKNLDYNIELKCIWILKRTDKKILNFVALLSPYKHANAQFSIDLL